MYYEFTKIEGKKYSFDLFVDVLFPLWQGNITKIIKIFPSFFYFLLIFFFFATQWSDRKEVLLFWNFFITSFESSSYCELQFHKQKQSLGGVSDTADLKNTHREKDLTIKLQCLRKIRIWIFVSLVHEITQIKSIFQKNKVVTGKTSLFMIGQFCSRHSICLNRKWLNGF